jgi:hypothetical protein
MRARPVLLVARLLSLSLSLLSASFVSAPSDAAANTITQNVSWTIDRPETTVKYRVVAYGDSIFAGYKGSISEVAIWAAPTVDGDYASAEWGADVQTIRRAKSGATAKQIYEDKIVDDQKFMQTANTRVVAIEMCGNDALQARTNFEDDDTCDYGELDDALASCTTYQELAMQFINENASPSVVRKEIVNLYYAGYDADDEPADCEDEESGQHPNRQDVFLPYLARINWRACNFARQYGFVCVDAFAHFMGSDYDTNGDRKRDVKGLKWRPRESEDAYVTRITQTLRSTIRDASFHGLSPQRTVDYIQSDDTHPTYDGGEIDLGLLGGSATGSGPPRYPLAQYEDGRVPIFKRFGHERMGWAMSVFNPATP